MQEHASQTRDEIRSIVEAILKAQTENDYELVSEQTDELTALIDEHEDKYKSYASVIKNSERGASNRKEEAQALSNLAGLLRQRLQDDMKQRNLMEVKASNYTIRIVKNEIPTVIVDIPAEQLPERFQRVVQRVESNKIELRSAIINGEEVEGVTLELGEHIKIYRY